MSGDPDRRAIQGAGSPGSQQPPNTVSGPNEPDLDELAPAPAPRVGGSVRAHLAVFTAVLAIPILLFVGFLLWQIAARERTRLEDEATTIARNIALAIDRQTTGFLGSLDVLSMSAYLKSDDLANFYEQARQISARQGIEAVLTDMSGQELVNVHVPWGSKLPLSTLPVDAGAVEQDRAFVTDLFVEQASGIPVFAAAVAVRRGDVPVYLLSFNLTLDRLQRLVTEAEIPTNYVVAVIDRNGTILARNLRPEEFVGKPASADLRASATGLAGRWSGTTVEGEAVFGAYERSRLTGFRAAVGVRYADLNAPLWRYLSVFLAVGVSILALSLVLGVFFGQRITAPIQALAGRAKALGRGEPVAPLQTALREANEVGAELAAASVSLREREADLREANEEVQRFAYIVSHDLRSPLVNIMGFTTELEALREDTFRRLEDLRERSGDLAERAEDRRLGEDFDEAIRFIKASIGKMDRLINAILKLSREGRREFRPERIDMNTLFATIKESSAIQAESAGATVTAHRLPAVISDRLAVEQVFSNLVDNAIKYLRSGVAGRIEITGRATRSSVTYEVRDNGRGIDAKDRERVFELFRRAGQQDKPGEGIGLAHVRALVRRLGGTITLTSEPGQGSTFSVTLPRRWSAEINRKAA